jgi:hypothetical protein
MMDDPFCSTETSNNNVSNSEKKNVDFIIYLEITMLIPHPQNYTFW